MWYTSTDMNNLGLSVQLSGDVMTAVAGATGTGTVYVFERDDDQQASPSTWTMETSLMTSGYGDNGTTAGAMFGISVSIDGSGSVIATGGPGLVVDGTQTGTSAGQSING